VNPTEPNDWDPVVERLRIEAFRRMSPSDKLRLMSAWTRSLIALARADVRRRHPEASDREVELHLAARWLDPELLYRAYGWRAEAPSPEASRSTRPR